MFFWGGGGEEAWSGQEDVKRPPETREPFLPVKGRVVSQSR